MDVHPWLDPSFVTGTTATVPLSDKFTDIGFDRNISIRATITG